MGVLNLTLKRLLLIIYFKFLSKLETTVANDDGIKSRFRFLGFFKFLDKTERIDDYDKILYEEEGSKQLTTKVGSFVRTNIRTGMFTPPLCRRLSSPIYFCVKAQCARHF